MKMPPPLGTVDYALWAYQREMTLAGVRSAVDFVVNGHIGDGAIPTVLPKEYAPGFNGTLETVGRGR